jgi:hypothetical protein
MYKDSILPTSSPTFIVMYLKIAILIGVRWGCTSGRGRVNEESKGE